MKREFLQELGLEGDIIDKVMSEYGKNVNALKDKIGEYDALKTDYKSLEEKYQTDLTEVNNKLNGAMANAADYETLKGTLETLKSETTQIQEQHQKDLLNVKLDKDIDLLLVKSNVDPEYLPLIKSQLNKDSLSYEGDKLIGGDDLVSQAQQKYPKLFGEIKKVGSQPDNGLNSGITKKEQLIKEYEAAQKAGNARRMMALSNQIKNLK